MRILVLIMVIAVSLSGCNILQDLRAKILNRGTNAVDLIKNKTKQVNDQYTNTKDSINERIDELNNAKNEVKEATTQLKKAVDAVDKIGGDKKAGKAEAPNLGDAEERLPAPRG